jgi:hypothetical protein
MEDIQPKSFLEKTKDAVSGIIDKGKETVSSVVDKGHETLTTETGSPNVLLIASVFLVMFVIYLIMYYHRQASYSPYLQIKDTIGPVPIHKAGDIDVQGDSIPDSKFSEEFSYSMWVYISDDTFTGEAAGTYIILSRGGGGADTKMVYAIDNSNENKHSKLLIRYAVGKGTDYNNLLNDTSGVIKCDVENVPYNTFFHLAVVVYGKSIVVYINGVLVKTITHSNKLATLDRGDHITNQKNTFKGYISKLRYFVDISKQDGGALSDKQVYDLYLNGPYPSLFERMVNSISRKFISFADTGEETGIQSLGINQLLDMKDKIEKMVKADATKAKKVAAAANKASEDATAAVESIRTPPPRPTTGGTNTPPAP